MGDKSQTLTPSERLGTLIRSARQDQGLSQEQLATLASSEGPGLSRAMISSIERGLHLPGIESLVQLTRALHIDAAQLLESLEVVPSSEIDLTGQTVEQLMQKGHDAFWAGEYRRALAYYEAMRDLVILEPGDPATSQLLCGKAEINRSTALRRMGAFGSAKQAVESAIDLTAGHSNEQAQAYMGLATILYHTGRRQLALDASERAVEHAEKGEERVLAVAHLTRGHALFESKNIDAAYDAYRASASVARRVKDRPHEARANGSAGICLLERGKPKEGMKRIERAIEIAAKFHLPAIEARWRAALGRRLFDHGYVVRAEASVRKAQGLARRIEDDRTIFIAEWTLHKIDQSRGKSRVPVRRAKLLRKLYFRFQNDKSFLEVEEYRHEFVNESASTKVGGS